MWITTDGITFIQSFLDSTLLAKRTNFKGQMRRRDLFGAFLYENEQRSVLTHHKLLKC
jgi:hypothetical protein